MIVGFFLLLPRCNPDKSKPKYLQVVESSIFDPHATARGPLRHWKWQGLRPATRTCRNDLLVCHLVKTMPTWAASWFLYY